MGKGNKSMGKGKSSSKSRVDIDPGICSSKNGKVKDKHPNGTNNIRGSKRAKNYKSCEEVEFSNHLHSVDLVIRSRKDTASSETVPIIATIHGFSVIEMPSDGNCMFHSIADQLNLIRSNYGNNSKSSSSINSSKKSCDHHTHHEIRAKVMDTIARYHEYFKAFHWDEEETFQAYISRLRVTGEWGGNSELVAASRLLRCNIYIFQHDALPSKIEYDPTDTSFESPGTQQSVALKGRKGSQKNPSTDNRVCSAYPNLFLSFHGDCHYNSMHPLRIEDCSGKSTGVLHSDEVPSVATCTESSRADAIENDDATEFNEFASDSVIQAPESSPATQGEVPAAGTEGGEPHPNPSMESSDTIGADGGDDIDNDHKEEGDKGEDSDGYLDSTRSSSIGGDAGGGGRVRFNKHKLKGKNGNDGPVLSKKEQRKLSKMFARQASLSGASTSGANCGGNARNADTSISTSSEHKSLFSGDLVMI